jgi:hypothetical protein
MQTNMLVRFFATVSFLIVASLQAQSASITIDLVTTFVYPQTGVQTHPQKINTGGDIAGEIILSTGETRGFVRLRNGSFSSPIIDPNEDGFLTDVRAINDSRLIAGYYILSSLAHGFFLSGNAYTDFNIPDALNTYIDCLNNAGDVAGSVDFISGNQGYINVDGNVTLFAPPGAVTVGSFGINNLNQIAGDYVDTSSLTHGFFRNSDGTFIAPIDYPGSTQTILFGINDKGWMVGRYVDLSGVTHGLFMVLPGSFVTYDFPDSTFTSLNGINNQGIICGRYLDSAGVEHGLIARARKTTD